MDRGIGTAALALAILAATGAGAWAQASGPSRPYHVDLALYFSSPDAEAQARAAVFAQIDAFSRHPAPDDAASLEEALRSAAKLMSQLARHEQYFELEAALDVNDRAAATERDAISAEGDRLDDALNRAMLDLSPEQLRADMHARPSLAAYAFAIEKIRRGADHALRPDTQAAAVALGDASLSDLWRLYQTTLDTTPFAPIATGAGEEDARAERRALLVNPDPRVRAKADEAWFAGLTAREPIYAGILLDIVDGETALARLHHFASAPEWRYFASYMTVADVEATLSTVQAYAGLNRRYETLQAAHVAAVAKLATPHSWDMDAPLAGFSPPRFSMDETRALAHTALAPLGAAYVTQFDALLDPRNHRADIGAGEPDRELGGFSLGYAGAPSVLFVDDYQGRLADADTVVHEGGHAVHRALMNADRVSPFYASGPHWMFEAFAILNEFLLDDDLYRTSQDPRAKAYYLNALVKEMAFQIFTSAEEGSLEQAIYDGAAAGRIRSGSDLDALARSALRPYDIWPESEPEQAHVWMGKKLLFEDPLYLVNYLYAGVLATKLYQMATDDPTTFQRKYAELLSNGFTAPPDVLLTRFFGRPTTTADLIPGAMDIFQARLETLRRLYAQDDGATPVTSAPAPARP